MKIIKHESQFELYDFNELNNFQQSLLTRAKDMRERARASVSNFMVGVVIEGSSGKIYEGCNCEDSAHTMTIHGEMGALGAMIADINIHNQPQLAVRVAVVLAPAKTAISFDRSGPNISSADEIIYTPCGHCRTMLAQYGKKTTEILCLQPNGQVLVTTIGDLYPAGFSF
ncbi:MAG: hypothetical protein AAB467_04040 [Patescibacteria group bacterium]|mgnify:CR=1 FL=1